MTANICRKTASDGHFRPNRKWKYGGNHTNELAAIDFLFDPPHTLWGLSRRYMPLLTRDVKHWAIVTTSGLGKYRTSALAIMAGKCHPHNFGPEVVIDKILTALKQASGVLLPVAIRIPKNSQRTGNKKLENAKICFYQNGGRNDFHFRF